MHSDGSLACAGNKQQQTRPPKSPVPCCYWVSRGEASTEGELPPNAPQVAALSHAWTGNTPCSRAQQLRVRLLHGQHGNRAQDHHPAGCGLRTTGHWCGPGRGRRAHSRGWDRSQAVLAPQPLKTDEPQGSQTNPKHAQGVLDGQRDECLLDQACPRQQALPSRQPRLGHPTYTTPPPAVCSHAGQDAEDR